jgi:hypothetical protein
MGSSAWSRRSVRSWASASARRRRTARSRSSARPCIGMCDQAPAAMMNDVVVTNLSTDKARDIVRELREHGDPQELMQDLRRRQQRHDWSRDGGEQPPQAGPGHLQRPSTAARRSRRRWHVAGGSDPRGEDGASARSRRGGLPHGHEVGVHAGAPGETQVRHLQRRRGRAGHVQGPRDPDRAARPRVRGHDDRGLRDRCDRGHPLPAG